MKQQEPLKAVVSVTHMARMCGLSRARFYQLTKEGIFPPPLRNQQTGRPYFDRDGQEECLTVRRTNRGVNGQAILFYAQRHGQHMPPPKPASRNGKRSKILDSSSSRHRDSASVITGLKHGLQQLGVTDVNDRRIRDALSQKYPDGHRDVDSAELLRSVFDEIQRRDSKDKQCG
jgi:hypothetical protein